METEQGYVTGSKLNWFQRRIMMIGSLLLLSLLQIQELILLITVVLISKIQQLISIRTEDNGFINTALSLGGSKFQARRIL